LKRSVFLLLIFLVLYTSACSKIQELVAETPTALPTVTPLIGTPAPTETPYLPGSLYPVTSHPDCPASPLTSASPPSKAAAQFPAVGWYQSQDGKLWAASARTVYSGETTFAWSKPEGSRLIVSAKRIDGDAPPFKAVIPDRSAGDYQTTLMIFPSVGCWLIQAQAGASAMEFILYVERTAFPPQGGECTTLDDAVRLADAIVVAKVIHTDASSNYAWQTLQVLDVWKNPFQNEFASSIELLQYLKQEPVLETGKTYLLFLQYSPWQTVCHQKTTATVTEQSVRLISGSDSLWQGTTLTGIQSEIEAILNP
jgi:hypothetical protein